MRKWFQPLALSFALLLFCAGTSAAFSLDGHYNMTIPDNNPDAGGAFTPAGEDNEVEPGNQPGQKWDLEAMFRNNYEPKQLTLVGGFDFVDGQNGGGRHYASGDIFIATGSVPPVYGVGNSTGDGKYQDVLNSYGYDYVIDLHWNETVVDGLTEQHLTLGYDVYRIDPQDTLVQVWFGENYESNPFRYASGGTMIGSGKALFEEGIPDNADLGFTNWQGLEGSRYALTVGLGFLDTYEYNNFYAHFTMGCGNDNLMGRVALGGNPPSPTPEPGTLLLLGAGLMAMSGAGRKMGQGRFS